MVGTLRDSSKRYRKDEAGPPRPAADELYIFAKYYFGGVNVKRMRKVIKRLLVGFGLVSAFILLLLALYYSFKTKGDVATMVAGLWSALATVVLGAIALFQSRQYKKLSDKANADYQSLQIEIRNLTDHMADAINTLQRIEKAKYLPNLEEWHNYYFGQGLVLFHNIIEDQNNTIQLNLLDVFQEDINKDIREIVSKYNTFAFCLKNTGEKTILDFVCIGISIPTNENMYNMTFHKPCDIKPGQFVYVFIVNLPNFLSIDDLNIKMNFKMQNLIYETYVCDAEIIMYTYENSPQMYVSFSHPIEERI